MPPDGIRIRNYSCWQEGQSHWEAYIPWWLQLWTTVVTGDSTTEMTSAICVESLGGAWFQEFGILGV